MRHDQAVRMLRAQAEALQARGATSLYLFGSTVGDAAGPESDLDLFIDYDEDSRFSLIELVAMRQYLEATLGVKVDLTTRDSLDRVLRPRIEAEAERIF